MKRFKKISSMILALVLATAMTVALMAVPAIPVAAADTGSVPSKVRIYSGYYDNYAIQFSYKNPGDKIKHLKTSSKNLVARQTYHSEYSESYSPTFAGRVQIGLYAKKEGKYTVTFDIYSKNGKVKRGSHKVTVYAKNDSPFRSITLDGKDADDPSHAAKKSAKLSVKMAKGYALKSIQVITGDKNGKQVEKKVKNNQKITFGQYAFIDSYSSDDYYSYWSKGMNATTTIAITYKDKYSKQLDTRFYSVGSRLSR